MDALEAFGDDRFDTGQGNALGGPVTGGALSVIGASNDDQRLLALHVGLDGFPHAGNLAVRLDAGQGALLHVAVLVQDHFVEQFRVREGGTLGGQVITPVGSVGVEVLLRQAHFRQVLTGCAAGQDRVGRRQVVSGDVVRQDRQRAHALEGLLTGQRTFPVWRAADVGALRAPLVQRAARGLRLFGHVEHRNVGLAELFRLDRLLHDGIDFLIARPDVLQGDGVAILVVTQGILLDVETDGAGNGVGHHQGR